MFELLYIIIVLSAFSYGLPIIESLSLLIQNFLNLGSAKLQEIANSKIENQNRTSAIGFKTTNDDDEDNEI